MDMGCCSHGFIQTVSRPNPSTMLGKLALARSAVSVCCTSSIKRPWLGHMSGPFEHKHSHLRAQGGWDWGNATETPASEREQGI